MPRPRRCWLSNRIYHITTRGNNRQPIFIDDEDRQRYLMVLDRCRSRFPYALLAFVLMPNHVHLIVQALPEASLSSVMHWVSTGYTKRFNERHGRSGHLFQGRFFSRLIDGDAYLLEATRYVHVNPVRAGLVTYPEEYLWSSYRVYAGWEREPFFMRLIDRQQVFSVLRGSGEERSQRYREFVTSPHNGAWHQFVDKLG